jgi:hypothetical protein
MKLNWNHLVCVCWHAHILKHSTHARAPVVLIFSSNQSFLCVMALCSECLIESFHHKTKPICPEENRLRPTERKLQRHDMQQFLYVKWIIDIYTLAHYINVVRLQSSGMMWCRSLKDKHQCFWGTCCLYLLQGLASVIFLPSLYHWPFFSLLQGFSILKLELLDLFKILVNISNWLHRITSLKAIIFILLCDCILEI